MLGLTLQVRNGLWWSLPCQGWQGTFKFPGSSLELPLDLLSGAGQLSQISPSIWGQQGTQTVILPSSPHPLSSTKCQPHPSAHDLIRLLPLTVPKGRGF